MGWVRSGWVEIFQFLVGWVGIDNVNVNSGSIESIWFRATCVAAKAESVSHCEERRQNDDDRNVVSRHRSVSSCQMSRQSGSGGQVEAGGSHWSGGGCC